MTTNRLCVIGAESFIGKNLESDIKLSRSDCNLLDFESTKSALSKAKVDSIINCVAKHGSMNSMSTNHVGYLEENIRINMNILRAAHELDIDKVLLLGSVSSFPFDDKEIVTERDYYSGSVNEVNFGYNSSKRFVVDLAKSYQMDYKRRFKVVHLGNIYGPHMIFGNDATVVGNLIHRIHQAQITNSHVELYGDGTDVRSLTFVKDLPIFFRWYMNQDSLMSPIICSSGLEIDIKSLFFLIAENMNFRNKVFFTGNGNSGKRKVAVSEIAKEVDIKQSFTPIVDGIFATVQWFLAQQGRPSSVGRASLS